MKFNIRNHSKMVKYGIPVLIILLIVGSSVVLLIAEQHREVTISEKWIKYHGNDAKHLVSDTDGNVYKVEDTTIFFKFDASNRYARLKVGESYMITTIGWRVTLMSMYPNIIEIEEAV